ncbi:MAG: glycogen debranching enzyme [Pseudohongiellaceae bacterium]|jgi:glycogen debranching enzyme
MSEIEYTIQSTASLLKALAIAVVVAAILFVTLVLPIEFGIDPTGLGDRLGVINLISAEPEPQVVERAGGDLVFRSDETVIAVPANSGLEYKFFLDQHSSLNYEWSLDSDRALYFDLHGEPQGDTTGYFESYGAATVNAMKGTITTPFAGSHGWYWRNETDEAVNVTLTTQGNYEIIGLK